MFALAIYDKRNGPGHERLLLARDQLGIKPLLYTTFRVVLFCFRDKGAAASGLVAREIDQVALRLLLTHGAIVQPHTILRGVKMLLPGHRLILKKARSTS